MNLMRPPKTATWIAAILFSNSLAADATKDPGGWAAVQLGMTPEEVVAALDNDGFLDSVGPEPQPFNLDESVDLPVAISFARETIANSKKDSANANTEVVDACKELLDKNRVATWTYAHHLGGGMSSPAQLSTRRLSGTLERIVASGAKGTIAYVRSLHVRVGSKVTQIPERSLDDKSQLQLQKIEQAVADLASAMSRAADRSSRDDDLQPNEARRIKAREVTIRGIKLIPNFTFSANRLTRISLSQRHAGENGETFDEIGTQQVLCDALTEKYGPPDQKNQKADSREFSWQFPTTVIRCNSTRASVPDAGVVRKSVRIVYEAPNAADTQSKDKL